jgi:hypothetical protein
MHNCSSTVSFPQAAASSDAHMLKLTAMQEITWDQWGHPDEER